MKYSGVEWIGDIPDDWEVGYVKQYFTIIKDLSFGAEPEKVLKLARSGIVEKDVTVNDGQMAASYDGYNKVVAGDLLLNPMDLYSGANCNMSELNGVISPAYVNLRAKYPLQTNSKYYDYYFKIQYWIMAMFAHGKGVSFDNRWTINSDTLKRYEIPILLYDLQTAIVSKIKQEEKKFDGLIANQQAQIEKLKQYKQSVITEVVTRGFNPNAPLKDSGIDWIGSIPEHWKASRIGRHYNITLGKMLCTSKMTNDYTLEKYFCAANVHFDGITINESLKEMWFSPEEKSLYLVKDGDLLVVEGGAGAGGCSVVCGVNDNVYVQNSIMIVRPKKSVDNRFLKYHLESLVRQNYIDIVCNKATIPHFTKDKLANTPFVLPPLEEQQQIADYLDNKCGEIDRLISLKQQKIDALTSYKKSLIYEYVTGKKEVI